MEKDNEMKKTEHVKLWEQFSQEEGFNPLPFNLSEALPEGYQIVMFDPKSEESLRGEWESNPYYESDWKSYDLWKNSLTQMGEIEYPSGDGRYFLRGMIEWPSMGLSYIYEIHPL